MHTVYVGDAKDVVKRIRSQHCGGNVESSALRKHIAQCKGYRLKIIQRSSGSRRVRIDFPEPETGERNISDYIRAGSWQVALCFGYDEAHDFQWYLIQQLNPLLNVTRKPWNSLNEQRYKMLHEKMKTTSALTYAELTKDFSGPGVYVLYHDELP
jgi:hypothetical protein